ncbi:Aste57867_10555 [Aphanomyces stellatus]|uniref:Aste57867_10555 protein n=1 Tax=Aphanomyces stellatus TaxID=120398 RepID=A0A485KQN5_9STRA|nr:hypothetical protein As57867_010515 [Aphanomyces stellatus]VFT87428.1 Aste57867_10555 [Aphanomyces stellatus]
MLQLIRRKTTREETARYLVDYRKAKKNELAQLQETFVHLERLRDHLASKPPRILPWRQVARALADARRLAETQHKALQTQVHEHHDLVRTMQAWVAQHTPVQTTVLDGACTTWRNVSLPAHPPASRQLAKDWIMNHMLHNIESVFRTHHFPAWDDDDAADEIHWDVDVVFHAIGGYTIVTRHYYPDDRTLDDDVAGTFKTLLSHAVYLPHYNPNLPLLVDDTDATMRQCAVVTPVTHEYCNVLAADFRLAPTHDVFVMQQIQDDDDAACVTAARHCPRRHRSLWSESRVRRRDGRRWVRVVSTETHLLPNPDDVAPRRDDDDAAASLDDDARMWGFTLDDCPDALKEARFLTRWKAAWVAERTRRSREWTAAVT